MDEPDARRMMSPDNSSQHRTGGNATSSNTPNSPGISNRGRTVRPSSTMLEENYIKSPRRSQKQESARALFDLGGNLESSKMASRSVSPMRGTYPSASNFAPAGEFHALKQESFSTVASSRKTWNWLKSPSEESRFTKCPSTWEAGGAVYGMHWVDLTSAGMRELALGGSRYL